MDRTAVRMPEHRRVALLSLFLLSLFLVLGPHFRAHAAEAADVPDEKNECGADGKAGTAKTSGDSTLKGGQKTHHLITVGDDGTVTLTCIPLTEEEERAGKKPRTWYLDRNGNYREIPSGTPEAEKADQLREYLYQSGTPTVATDGSHSRTSMNAEDFTTHLIGTNGVDDALRNAFGGNAPPPVLYPVDDVMHNALENAIYGNADTELSLDDAPSKYNFAFADDFSRGYAEGVTQYGTVPLPKPAVGPYDTVLGDGTIARGGPAFTGSYNVPVRNVDPLLIAPPPPQTFAPGPEFDLTSPYENEPLHAPVPAPNSGIGGAYGALKGYASRFYNWLGGLF